MPKFFKMRVLINRSKSAPQDASPPPDRILFDSLEDRLVGRLIDLSTSDIPRWNIPLGPTYVASYLFKGPLDNEAILAEPHVIPNISGEEGLFRVVTVVQCDDSGNIEKIFRPGEAVRMVNFMVWQGGKRSGIFERGGTNHGS